jgi:hypothetical protein
MNLHIGDPCVFCAVAHDDAPSGECPRNMIKEPRLEELYADPRAAMILKGEIRLLIPAYRLLRDHFAVKSAFPSGAVYQMLKSIREPNNGFVSSEEARLGVPMMSALCNCDRLPNEHELCECYPQPLTDELLQKYIDGLFSEDVKHRGQELAHELLTARRQLKTMRLAYRMQNPQGIPSR